MPVPDDIVSFSVSLPAALSSTGQLDLDFLAGNNTDTIEIRQDGNLIYTANGNDTEYNITGLTPGTQYSITLTPVNSIDGSGNTTSPIAKYTYSEKPSFSVVSITQYQIEISVVAPTYPYNNTNYYLDNAFFGQYSILSFTWGSLNPGTNYTIEVCHNNGDSIEGERESLLVSTQPITPTNGQASNRTTSSVDIVFDEVSCDNYVVFYFDNNLGTYTSLGTIYNSGDTLSTPFIYSTSAYIKAYKGSTASESSNIFTIPEPPANSIIPTIQNHRRFQKMT